MHVPTSPNGTHPNGRTHSPIPDAKPPTADGERAAGGRFGKGNAGGPGNPFARQVAALRRTLLASVTEEDVEAVARELVRRAKDGDLAAAKLLLSYTLGKPAAAVDPDTLDQQEWDIYRRSPDPGPDLGALAGRMPLPLANRVARAMLPGLDRDWTRQWAYGFRQNEFEEQLEAAARAERAARRQERKERRRQERAATKEDGAAPEAAPQSPAPDAEALNLLARLLAAAGDSPIAVAPPSANGGNGRTAPSPNGPSGAAGRPPA
ncbi:MAG TPA: hypothetical protein VFE78_04325 [Gemmataceae bacterium]|nr:hypothetical protein [Gemmataceae bacterium]